MISWILSIAGSYLVKAALIKYGLTAAQAALLAPKAIRTFKEVANFVKLLKAQGKTDDQIVQEVERKVLDPRSPDYKVTYQDITSPRDNV